MLAIQAEEGEGSRHPSEPQPPPSTDQPTNEELIPNVVTSSHQKTQTPRQALNQVTELPQTSDPIPNVADEAVYEEWDNRVERATTTAASLDVEQASVPGAKKPWRVPLLRLELMVLCTTLSKKVESLEADLKQTKKVYRAAYTKLIKKVKKLEKTVKSNQARRRAKIVVLDDEEDLKDSSKQGRMIEEIDQDAGVTLVTPTHSQEDQLGVFGAAKVLTDAAKENVHTYTRRKRAVSTGSDGISTAEESVSTVSASMLTKRTKPQQEQERPGHEAVVRLQEELDEEERQRMDRVQKAAQSFTEEEWDNIKARQLKRYSFDELKELFETTMKNVNTFVLMETEDRERASELAAGSSEATIIDFVEVESSKRAAEA
ncbi:hypothetical protein Tco_1125981 [Tanacetum coccineum]